VVVVMYYFVCPICGRSIETYNNKEFEECPFCGELIEWYIYRKQEVK